MRPSGNPLLLEAFGLSLKERRVELNLTQEDVAGAAEIDRPYITLMEAARKQPTISVFWKLAAALQLEPSALAQRIEVRYSALETLKAAGSRTSNIKSRR